jgi:hypothetical protein
LEDHHPALVRLDPVQARHMLWSLFRLAHYATGSDGTVSIRRQPIAEVHLPTCGSSPRARLSQSTTSRDPFRRLERRPRQGPA